MSGNNLPDGRRDINTSNLSCHKEFSFWKCTLTHLLFFIRAHEWAHSKKLFFNCYNQKCYWSDETILMFPCLYKRIQNFAIV